MVKRIQVGCLLVALGAVISLVFVTEEKANAALTYLGLASITGAVSVPLFVRDADQS